MSSHYYSEVIIDLERALENGDDYDVIIKAGEDAKELRAHSFVLRTRCSYFKSALSGDWREKDDDGYYIFKKPNVSFEVFQLILKYLYTGFVDYDQHNKDMFLQFLVAADEFGLSNLIEHIQKNEEFVEFVQKDPVNILNTIYKHEPFERLKDHCLDIISEDPRILFTSEKFPLLEKPMIKMILKGDDFNMEEVDIWDSLLRWIFIHHLNIGKDDSSWSSEGSANVKQTMQEFIPLIRFYDISKEDFFLKVYPYRDLLPQDLLNDILRCHMIPDSTPMLNFLPPRSKSNSGLVNYNVFKLFAKWIDEKDDSYTRQSMPYKFDLLLRGTRDGFDIAKFHQLCDNKGATVVFGRIKDSKQIVGGYNPLNWHQNNSYLNTNESFLFNIPDSQNLEKAKLGRIINCNNVIYGNSGYGPTFGGGHDLRVNQTSWTSSVSTFSNISIPSSFTVDEYEIFQVVKQ